MTGTSYVRLTEPLVRDGRCDYAPRHGMRRSIGPRRGSADIIARHGGDALGIFSCSKSTNEMNFLAQKLARVAFGTHNIDSCNRT